MKLYSLLSSKLRFYKPWFLTGVLFAGFFGLAAYTYAQGYLGSGWDKYLGPLRTFTDTGQTGEELAIGFIRNGVAILRNLVGGLALILGAVYATQLVFSGGSEEAIEKQKKNFLWVFMGFLVLIIAENVAKIFNPEKATSTEIIDFDAARDQLRDIVDYLKWIIGSIIVLFMTITGVRMIISADDEEELTKQKESLTWGLIGILVILLASNIVNAIYVINAPDQVVAGGAEQTITQVASVIRLILVFLGPIAIAFTIYAGVLYLTAMDEDDQAEKGKKMIIGGITGIVIIYAAYALVNTLIDAPLAAAFLLKSA